ncbi:hypothetical protein EDB81DRAFT_653224 [Dactylonectria macrodidyma]|uniref:Tyrosinase copper-binding domain-containing protein n=1 Tax=Dactylonectria macrodidyma TaxID=307937 RepID=A0A9P9ER97_9HYPO|nr:hypothetical protein EDB81DRAFT_653224 [Dactylonectria macrodidyma]
MRLHFLVLSPLLASIASGIVTIKPLNRTVDDTEDLKSQVLQVTKVIGANVLKTLEQRKEWTRKRRIQSGCTAKRLIIRREYGSLTENERLAYVNAVKCLQNLPAQTPANVSLGARSRFDDFVVVHIQQTRTIHFTGNFMPWHRWFLYTYEKALREECGYKGYQPYWDWPKYASAPEKSPIFNGDAYSLGGNGEYVPHNGPIISPPEGISGSQIQLPAGLGGGYVTTGPFANMSVNLGPGDNLGYNPRRLKRDVGPALNQIYGNYTTLLELLKKPNFDEYRLLSEGVPGTIDLGPHGGMHFTIGGDPGADLFTSPGDPAFWLHHGMMDRMWALWQASNPNMRKFDLGSGNYSHITWDNKPESRRASLDDVLDMGYAGKSATIKDVMDTTSGPFCYFYS